MGENLDGAELSASLEGYGDGDCIGCFDLDAILERMEGWRKRSVEPIHEVQRLLPSLSRGEKAQVLKWVVQELGDDFAGIDSSPSVCGGDACIARTRIPVWLLERYRRLGVNERDLLDSYPTLRAEDLANTWAYARVHAAEIEQQIERNEEA